MKRKWYGNKVFLFLYGLLPFTQIIGILLLFLYKTPSYNKNERILWSIYYGISILIYIIIVSFIITVLVVISPFLIIPYLADAGYI